MRATPLLIAGSDRAQLEKWVRSTTTRFSSFQRARIVLLAVEQCGARRNARRVAIGVKWSSNGRARYEDSGTDGLLDEERSEHPRTLKRTSLISVTRAPPTAKYPVMHLSSWVLAEHVKIGHAAVARVA